MAALRGYAILDSAPELAYDDIVNLAALVCDTPYALISLIDRDRQWFKAAAGISGLTETSRDISFCAHALPRNEVMQVPDTALDERFFDNPQVIGPLRIRFYAGAPLFDRNGMALGALCVGDVRPRELTPRQLEALAALARQVTTHIETRSWAALITHQQNRLAYQARMAALGQLAGEVAHEINTPLCSLTLGLDLIEDRLGGQAAEELGAMKRSARKISAILQNLLSFTRREGRGAAVTDLFRATETTVGFHRERFREHGVKLMIDPAILGGACPVRTDAAEFSEALGGLLAHAYDAARERDGEAWVRVSRREAAHETMLVVTDSGAGVSSAELASLGLMLSKGIMEKLGGRVEQLEGEAHTSFALVFPHELSAVAVSG